MPMALASASIPGSREAAISAASRAANAAASFSSVMGMPSPFEILEVAQAGGVEDIVKGGAAGRFDLKGDAAPAGRGAFRRCAAALFHL